MEQNKELERENILLQRLVFPETFSGSEAPFYQILYRFENSDNILLRPLIWARESSPEGNRYILKGDFFSMKAKDYLRRSKSHAFVVYKTYANVSVDVHLEEEAQQADTWALPDPIAESILFVSQPMIKAVRNYLSRQYDVGKISEIVDLNREIPAPYLFWYHFRSSFQSTLNELSPQHRGFCSYLLSGSTLVTKRNTQVWTTSFPEEL